MSISSPPKKFTFEPPDLAAARFLDRLTRAGIELLEAVASDPARAVAIAEAEGVTDAVFSEDLKLIWLSFDVCRQQPIKTVYAVCRESLKANYKWGWATRSSYGTGTWSNCTLHILYDRAPFSPQLIRVCSRRLIDLANRWAEAERHSRYIRQILEAA